MVLVKLHYVLVVTAVLFISCNEEQEEVRRPGRTAALVDSLAAIFHDLKEAGQGNQVERFLDLLHPVESAHLKGLIRRHGYTSMKSFIGRQFHAFPDLDTLSFYELRQAGSYARLSYTGRGATLGHKKGRVKYTFLLFRKGDQTWKLAAMTSLVKEQRDLYGYEITYHETELPPKLRFPRHF